MIRTKRRNLARQMGLVIRDDEDQLLEAHVLPYQKAPVVLHANGKRELRTMQFSLVPAWSKERRVKFATHNARLWSLDPKSGKSIPIYEKATWRGAFARRHCLVPMTDFIEPIYSGEYAGNMVRFHREDQEVLGAAAIWEEWTSRETGEVVDSFSIITDDPHPFVSRIGHDRTPLFICPDTYDEWLEADRHSPAEFVAFLRNVREVPKLAVEIERPLKAGWEKRRPRPDA